MDINSLVSVMDDEEKVEFIDQMLLKVIVKMLTQIRRSYLLA